ncbi:nickel pincer cofactor biosynthesis protein LarC [Candidatus Woesearchaeota archaeon]|nr:nickel pincer cofactor biosynthesis protein LarC [Candidatus Woesearchaeota archaeon]
MKALYFNCHSGISGNMVVGALLDLGIRKDFLLNELSKLSLENYSVKIKSGKHGTTFIVNAGEEQEHRHISDIYRIIDDSKLCLNAKELGKRIFLNLAKAEAKVHRCGVENIHFHEVGAIDSIIDIVSAAILLDRISPERVFCGRVSDGKGKTRCAHGVLELPVPAVRELLKDFPMEQIDINSELVTPTGAAILKTIVDDFIPIELIKPRKRGFGNGTKKLPIRNALEIIECDTMLDERILLETNIDDMNTEVYPYVIERLIKAGATDAFIQPVVMKKNRIGMLLSVTCRRDNMHKLIELMFEETTTFGIRINKVNRVVLDRELKQVRTKHGLLKIKVGKRNDKTVTVSPEYESAKKLAKKKNIPLKYFYTNINA